MNCASRKRPAATDGLGSRLVACRRLLEVGPPIGAVGQLATLPVEPAIGAEQRTVVERRAVASRSSATGARDSDVNNTATGRGPDVLVGDRHVSRVGAIRRSVRFGSAKSFDDFGLEQGAELLIYRPTFQRASSDQNLVYVEK